MITTNTSQLVYTLLVIFFIVSHHVQLGNASSLNIIPNHLHQTFQSCKIDEIYQLGDSMADTGNLIHEFPIGASSSSGRLPYGQDFHNHLPTGRFSNGLLMIDYLASSAGLPLLDPYKNVNGNFKHGVNFAVAGSTALSSHTLQTINIPCPVTNSSLDVQLQWMSSHFDSTCQTNCAEIFKQALFFIGEIGGNDYNNAFNVGKSAEELKLIVHEVVQVIKSAARRVIHLGAIRLIIPGDFPAGCFPHYLTTYETDDYFAYDENHCWKDRNNLSAYHNDHLQQVINELKQEFPNVTIIYADYYNAFLHLFKNARKHGFDEESTRKACCGVGGKFNYDPKKSCGCREATVCDDPNERISWDGIHLTQAAYRIMAEWLLNTIYIPQLQCSAGVSSI